MAGVKGKSGGARANSGGPRPNSGGARPGAGRKAKPPAPPVPLPQMDTLQMLQRVALGEVEATPLQVRAAIAAVQYTHTKKGDGGKKEEQADRAKQAGTGRFKASAPPLHLIAKK
jgi:phage terminase small subunit